MVGLGEGQGDGIATESVRLWSAGDGGGEGDEQGVLLAVSVERVRCRGWCSSLRKSTERAECSLLRIRGWDAMRRGLREGMERGWTTRSGDGWRGGGESGRTKMDIGAGKQHCSAAGVYKEQEGDLVIYRGSPDSVTGCQPATRFSAQPKLSPSQVSSQSGSKIPSWNKPLVILLQGRRPPTSTTTFVERSMACVEFRNFSKSGQFFHFSAS